jgi:hypothetical protein
MIPTLILLSFAQVPTQEWRGQITVSIGAVVLARGGQELAAGGRAGLLPGDRLRTGSDGAAALILPNGVFAYLGPTTEVQLNGRDDTALRLEAGELRILVGADSNPLVRLPAGTLNLSRGAFRVQLSGQDVRVGVEAGMLRGELASMQTIALAQGQEVSLRGGRLQEPTPLSNEGWQIDVERLLADALAEEMRRRRRVDRPDPTRGADEAEEPMRRPPGATQNQVASASIASAAIGSSASPGVSASAGLFSDAAQFTLQGRQAEFASNGTLQPLPGNNPFPGNIHLVTGETRYGLPGVNLSAAESNAIFPGGSPTYFSIGRGPPPTTQVVTSFNTASNAPPTAIAIPGFNFHVVRLDQYGPIDAALDPTGAQNSNVGYAGLLGTNPTAPTIVGTAPLRDERADINSGATFALGEFRLRPNGGADNNSFELAVRRSDQDRIIVKDSGGNDAEDLVRPNPEVGAFDDVADPRFLPAAPTVKVPRPGTYNTDPTRFSRLNNVRRGAATTILADQLHGFAQRTGQTRFVIDGKVIDISGYRR